MTNPKPGQVRTWSIAKIIPDDSCEQTSIVGPETAKCFSDANYWVEVVPLDDYAKLKEQAENLAYEVFRINEFLENSRVVDMKSGARLHEVLNLTEALESYNKFKEES